MSGNFVIGIIVFTILVIVNFVVITKGSGRIAEVAARFHFDAMPGKQMAIDADLSAGLIDEDEARRRRRKVEDESGFFGAMDGASKFVRGDAIAGLLVVFINVIGGMIIGIAQQGMSFADAARTYTLLTVGDGLVTQVPALIVSTAAGLLVSKAGVAGAADKALISQFSGYPKALGMSAAVMLAMAAAAGHPDAPVPAARRRRRCARPGSSTSARSKRRSRSCRPPKRCRRAPAEEPISTALKIDDLKIELGYALLPLVNSPDGSDRLTEQIKALRRSLAIEMGFVMPSVRILDNVQLDANTYVIKIKEVEAGAGRIWPGQYMVMDPTGAQVTLPGVHTSEPTFGLPATWVDAALKEDAAIKGYTVVDAATVLSTHLTELIKANVSELISYAEVNKLIKDLPKEQADLVKDHRAGADHDLRHPARAAAPAGGAGIDPRPPHHPRRHRRRHRVHPQPGDARRACARAALAPALRAIHHACRPPADHRALGAVGADLRRVDHRPGRRPHARHAALAADRVHHARARAVRGRRAAGRGAGAGDVGGGAAVRARDRRAVPVTDAGAVAGRDPPARAAQDGARPAC